MQFFNPNNGPQKHPTEPGTFSTLGVFFQPRHLSPPSAGLKFWSPKTPHPTGNFFNLGCFFLQPRHLSAPYRVEISPAGVIFFLPSPCSPHTSDEARPTQGPLIYGCCQGVQSRGLRLEDEGGDGAAPEVRLLDGLVGVLEEQGELSTPPHRAAYWEAAHIRAQGFLVCLWKVQYQEMSMQTSASGRSRSMPRALPDCTSLRWRDWT